MIPREEWKWHGMPGHFVGSMNCCFHLVTDIGGVRVSTIGCYHTSGEPKDYEHRTQIGAGRLYETFVFPLGGDGPRDMEAQSPLAELTEIDSEAANTETDAEAAHARMCEKWAALDGDPEQAA